MISGFNIGPNVGYSFHGHNSSEITINFSTTTKTEEEKEEVLLSEFALFEKMIMISFPLT